MSEQALRAVMMPGERPEWLEAHETFSIEAWSPSDRKRVRIDVRSAMEQLTIVDKHSDRMPLRLKFAQEAMYSLVAWMWNRHMPIRLVVLKGRQMGISTFTEALLFVLTSFQAGQTAAIITDQNDHTTNLFNMSKRFYDRMPEGVLPRLKSNNARVLEYEGTDSSITVFTAGEGAARSATLRMLHASEFASWKQQSETMVAATNSIPSDEGTIIVVESTAKGFDGFKGLWDDAMAGNSVFVPVFLPWYLDPEYTMPYTGFRLSPEEEQLKREYRLTDGQLEWRRYKIREMRNDTAQFHQEYPSCPSEAFLSTGQSVFDNTVVARRKDECAGYRPQAGYFAYMTRYDRSSGEMEVSQIKWVPDSQGEILIYQEPIKGFPYAIGGDPSNGGSDYSVGQVIRNTDLHQVAVYRKNGVDSDLFALQLYCLGKYYNGALIGTETNIGGTVMTTLAKCRYPSLFMREREDTIGGGVRDSYGFRTTVANKARIIERMKSVFRDDPDAVCDYMTLCEMESFVVRETYSGKNGNTTMRAEDGKHDDTVMALAIAYEVGGQQSTEAEGPSIEDGPAGKVVAWAQGMLDRSVSERRKKAWGFDD